MKVNLGAYNDYREGYVNLDIAPTRKEIIQFDLGQKNWYGRLLSMDLIQAKGYEEVLAYDILEHLGELTKVQILKELADITAYEGIVKIRVPNVHHPWAITSLQHAHFFGYNIFEPSYAQPYFNQEFVGFQFSDGGQVFEVNSFNRWLPKWTRFVYTLHFVLRRK